jgi:predicted O-methyltransferase YrrM
MYKNPEIESSYQENNIGKTLYDTVIKHNPKIIVEFGCLYGYSTVAMAQALKHLNNNGKIYCYDIWEEYPYKHSTLDITKNNIKKYDVEDYVEFFTQDYYEWLQHPTNFDLMHLDISNDGNTILNTYNALLGKINDGAIILFEGGSVERDNVRWMQQYKARPIQSVKEIVQYNIINEQFPSISLIQ